MQPLAGEYAGLFNLGWAPFPGDAAPLSLTVHGVHGIEAAAGALLTLNYSAENPVTLSYRVNSGAWRDETWPFGACYTQNGFVSCGAKTLAVPVPVADVQTGDNIIQIKSSDGAEISNVDLILIGAGGVHAPDVIFREGFD